MPDDALISVEGLRKSFGSRIALDALSLTVRSGEVVGLVGANGGGKTTSLRILAGLLPADAGSGTVLGYDVRRQQSRIRAEIGYLSQGFALYAGMTVRENLELRAALYSAPGPAVSAALNRFGLAEQAAHKIHQLSGGWKRRAQLAASLLHGPRLVLLDEPTAGLDLVAQSQIWTQIFALASEGAGVLVATHDLGEAERCASIGFFSNGRILARGTPGEIIAAAGEGAISLKDAAFILIDRAGGRA